MRGSTCRGRGSELLSGASQTPIHVSQSAIQHHASRVRYRYISTISRKIKSQKLRNTQRAKKEEVKEENMTPVATLSHLNRADGSATYRHQGYTIIGAVNGPIEVQRRDELPSEATIEVNIRPAAGVGSTYTPMPSNHVRTMLTPITQAPKSATSRPSSTAP